MNILSKIFLIIIFVPVFLILLILISFKFQILSPSFWTEAFNNHGVYQNLESIAPSIVDYQIKNNKEIKVNKKTLVALLTHDNLKEFIEKNINHTINYANGKENTWTIFVPTKKLPKGLLPNFLLDKEEVSLDTFMSFLGRGGEVKNETSSTSHFSLAGNLSTISLIIWSLLVLTILFSLYRVNGIGIALPAAGVLTLLLIGVVNTMKSEISNDLVSSGKEPAQMLLGTIAPSVITEITDLWKIIAVSLIIVGLILGYLQRERKLK